MATFCPTIGTFGLPFITISGHTARGSLRLQETSLITVFKLDNPASFLYSMQFLNTVDSN